jgi:hypothetical protein
MAPLQWMTATSIVGLVALVVAKAEGWVIGTYMLVPIGLVAFSCVSYETHRRKNPDALRSERYSLRKIEIEKGMIGDDRHGIVDSEEVGRGPVVVQPQGRLADASEENGGSARGN